MVENKKSEKDPMVAQLMMSAARAYYHASESCLKDRDNYKGYDNLTFHVVCLFLKFHSIEISLKLSLFLENISVEPTHNIFQLYEQTASVGNAQRNLQGNIVDFFNQCAEADKLPKCTGDDIETCLKRHRLSNVDFRYFGVEKDFQSAVAWAITDDEVRIILYLSASLLNLNLELMDQHGISVIPTELPKKGASKDSKTRYQFASKKKR